jgi:hypothetical protein
MTKSICLAIFLFVSQTAVPAPTVREVLVAAGIKELALYPDNLLSTRLTDDLRKGQYFHLAYHINPSAEGLLIFSNDKRLIRELYGWELVNLPNDGIVYHKSQVHFAPTHWLEMSVFDPITRRDRQIYPPKPYQPVRKAFIERVANAYKVRGEDWFRIHNHHMDPELFDSALVSEVVVDAGSKSISFVVRFGDRENANDPLPFSETALVRCAPIDRIEQLQCFERAQ